VEAHLASRCHDDAWGPGGPGSHRLNIDLSTLLIIAIIAVAAPLISELPVWSPHRYQTGTRARSSWLR